MADVNKERKTTKIKEIEVIDAKKPGEVELKIRGIHCIFRQKEKRIRLVAKFNPYAHVYDPADLWISPELFKKACRQAAQILTQKHSPDARKQIRSTAKGQCQLKSMLGIKGGSNEKEDSLPLVH